MRDFEYEAPTTLDAAIQILSTHNGSARPLAGGTDLIDYIRTGRLAPQVVVDIKQIPELQALEETNGLYRIGAAVSCRRICRDERVRKDYAALVDACSIIGSIQIQNRASVGGNLCTSGAAADSTPTLIALGAVCDIAGPAGIRTIDIEEFCTGPAQNCLQAGEMLVSIGLPVVPERTGSHYRRFIPRNEMDIAVVGVGAQVTLNADGTIAAARVGMGAVAPKPFLATDVNTFLTGKQPTDAVLAEAGQIARGLVSPIDDHRGTIEFRTHVAGVLVERVLREAIDRALI